VCEVPKLLLPPRTPQLLPLQKSVIAPLLCISSAADAAAITSAVSHGSFFSSSSSSGSSGGGGAGSSGVVTAAGAAMSPATALFTQLRSYPRNAGEVEGAKRVLQGVLGRVADAVHQVMKRLAGFKVKGGGSGDYVWVDGWLW